MITYAVRNSDGTLTGVRYAQLTDAIREHHAQYDQTLIEAVGLENVGTDDAPEWVATPPSIEDMRARWVVSRFQARSALAQAGLLDRVTAAVAASDDAVIQLAWAEATEFPRLSPTIATLAHALGLSDAQLDELFITASTITA